MVFGQLFDAMYKCFVLGMDFLGWLLRDGKCTVTGEFFIELLL